VLLLVCVPAALWIACWPFADSPVNDDFSYAFTVKRLLETGRLTYNGWGSPMLGPQALWGAAFAYVMGFSHDALRFSMLPVSIGCAALTYTLHRRLDISPALSLFATLLLVGSPLFTAWSASFMNDVPGLLFTLMLFHSVIGAMKQQDAYGVMKSCLLIVLVGVVGGTVRQSVFVMAFAALCVALLRHRQDRRTAIGLVVTIFVYLTAVVLLAAWHARQPYTLVELWPTLAQMYERSAIWTFAFFLELGLYLLPLGLVLIRIAPLSRKVMTSLGIAFLSISFALDAWAPDSVVAALFRGLWIGNTVTPNGLLDSEYDAPGFRPIVFGNSLRLILGAAVFWQLSILLLSIRAKRSELAGAWRTFRVARMSDLGWTRAALLLMGGAYIMLLIPRAALPMLFDRYLLVVLPLATVLSLTIATRSLANRSIPKVAWILLSAYVWVGFACTRDHFAELRLREHIASEFDRDGIGRTELANGLASDAWTQLLSTGYINDSRIRQPVSAIVMGLDPQRTKWFWFLNHTPAMKPRYVASNWPTKPSSRPGTRVYTYTALMPPFERWIVVWPVNSTTAATGPLPGPETAKETPAAGGRAE
jgi:hypothetical protein